MIEFQQLEVVFFGLLGLVVLTLVALVIYLISADRQKKLRPAAPPVEDSFILDTPLQPTGDLLTLVRGAPGESVQVRINGVLYRHMSEILDAEVRRQVVESAMALIRFTGVLGTEVVAPAPVDKTYSWREDLRQGSRAELERAQSQPGAEKGPAAQPPAPPDQDVEARFLSLLADLGSTPSKEKPNLVTSIQHRWSKPAQQETPRSFVDDIEAIVQRKLALAPALASRDLHVRLGAGGAVRFVFEGQEFESVDDIPNLTAQQLVKDAIREWDETA